MATGTSCLALVWVMGRRRVPAPPDSTRPLRAADTRGRLAAGRRVRGRAPRAAATIRPWIVTSGSRAGPTGARDFDPERRSPTRRPRAGADGSRCASRPCNVEETVGPIVATPAAPAGERGAAGERDRRHGQPQRRRHARGRPPPPARAVVQDHEVLPRLAAGPRQGRGDVEEPRRAVGRDRRVAGRRRGGLRPRLRHRPARPAAGRARGRLRQGALPPPPGRRRGRRRAGHRDLRPAADQPLLPRAGGLRPAALGRGRGAGRELLRAVPFFTRLRRRARPADRPPAAHAGLGALAQVDLGDAAPREPADRGARGDGLGHHPGGAAARGGRGARARGRGQRHLRAPRPRGTAATCWARWTRGRGCGRRWREAASVRA